MRKIRIFEHISLDGVIQAPGGPDEDVDGDFKHGGWAAPHADPAVGEAIDAAHGKRFDLLLGRRTYDATDDVIRNRCFAQMREARADEETELWLRRLRDEAFVDLRM